jgi:hypothetical protein
MKYDVMPIDGDVTQIECEWIEDNGEWLVFKRAAPEMNVQVTTVAMIRGCRVLSVNIVE